MGTTSVLGRVVLLCEWIARGKLMRLIVLGGIVLIASASARVPAAWAHPSTGTQACASSGGSVKSQTTCAVMPASGAFRLTIPGTAATLIGTGTPDRAGKPIEIARAPLLCPNLGGFGIRITTPRSAGLLPPLRWATGTLYARNPATGTCSIVTSPAVAAAPGTYQVVAGTPSGVSAMPRSGGGSADLRPASQYRGMLLVGLVLLLVGAMLTRQRGASRG